MGQTRRRVVLAAAAVAAVAALGLAWRALVPAPVVVTPLGGRVKPLPPAAETVDGAALRLNGAGIRWALNWDAYDVSLYLPSPATTFAALVDGPGPARLVLRIRRPLEKVMVERAFRAGVRRATGEGSEESRRLQPLFDALRAVAAGERLVLTWRRGKGLVAEIGATVVEVAGDPQARAIFAIWLGDAPVDPVLRAELLEGLR